ncbi:hypothetical protein AB0L88_20855 [Saccharopolyspora shandongensis]|uniref:hypothetical protein n=1 Tax=Saccharopolyspora shandongensis TaxID=418495 RepID=UPI00342660DE
MADEKKEEESSFGEEFGSVVGGIQGGITGLVAGPAGVVAGAKIGSEVGEAVGGAVQDAGEWVGETVSDAGSWLVDNAGGIADTAMSIVNPVGGALFEKITDGGFSALQEKAKAAEERKGKFDDAKKKLEGGGSVGTSDELLDDGKMGLDFFEKFLPLYKDWAGKGADFKADVVEQYDQLREIDFGAFREDAERLGGVQQALLDQNDSMGRSFQGSRQTWQGKAAESAEAKVGKYSMAGTTVTNETENMAGAITPAVDGIQQTVREYAKFVLELGKEIKCAGKDPDDTKDEIRKARGDINLEDLKDIGIDDIFSGAWSMIKDQAIGLILGGPIGGMIGQFFGAKDACDQIRQGLIDDAKKWLDESFKPEMEQKYQSFKDQSKSTQDAVQASYDKMLEASKVSDDPFKGLDGDGDKGGNDKGGNGTGGGGGNGTGGGGGSGTGGGGGSGTGGGGGAPEMPEQPEMPKPPEMPGMDGGAGEQGEQEKVTLGEGDDAVTVQKPGPDGKTQVELIGPDGKPKTYEVDFGPAGGAPGGADGVQTMPAPGGVPGQPPVGGPPGGEGPTQVKAGEDGKAVIKEGDRTITLERTPDGQVKVNIDNGGGQPPMNQTIDFGSDPKSPIDERIGTMPADAGGLRPPETGVPGPDIGTGTPENVRPMPADVGPPMAEPGVGGPMPAPDMGVPMPAPDLGAPMPAPDAGFGTTMPAYDTGVGTMPAADPGFGAPAFGGGASTMPAFDTGAGVPAATEAASAGAPASTSPQSAGMSSFSSLGEGVQNSFGSASGQLFGGQDQPGMPGGSDQNGSTGLASLSSSAGDSAGGSPQGATGLSSLGDPGGAGQGQAGPQSGQGGNQSAAMGGGMMGGMGAMGGGHGAQQGGDQERTNDSPWRTQGQLFDDGVDASGMRFRSVLGEDRDR